MILRRKPNHVDEPTIEPSKLFRVERIKPIKGNPFWEKRILKQLGVGELEVCIRKRLALSLSKCSLPVFV